MFEITTNWHAEVQAWITRWADTAAKMGDLPFDEWDSIVASSHEIHCEEIVRQTDLLEAIWWSEGLTGDPDSRHQFPNDQQWHVRRLYRALRGLGFVTYASPTNGTVLIRERIFSKSTLPTLDQLAATLEVLGLADIWRGMENLSEVNPGILIHARG